MHHLEAARWHTDLVLKREKLADRIGRRAAAVLESAIKIEIGPALTVPTAPAAQPAPPVASVIGF
jgi:hypothetical protein